VGSFSIDEHRRVSVDDVAQIDYMPDIYLRRAAVDGAAIPQPVPLLTMTLRSGERIRIEGARAALAWNEYLQVSGKAR
jgi:hypothetical protein